MLFCSLLLGSVIDHYMIISITAAAAVKSLQLCPTLRPHRWQPTRLPHPWDSPDKNTGVGCHFLLQGMKGKSESEVAQSCPTPSDSMDCSLPGSSIHGICQARVLEWGVIAFSQYYHRTHKIAFVFIEKFFMISEKHFEFETFSLWCWIVSLLYKPHLCSVQHDEI